MIELKFLGKGAAFYPKFGNTNAMFEIDKNLYFLDFGESAFDKVIKTVNLESYESICVILTHLHADHVGSLASFISYMYCILNRQILVVHPVDTVVKLLSLLGISKDFYKYSRELPQNSKFTICPHEVEHANDMKAFGYVIEHNGEKIYYSGDAANIPEKVLNDFLAGKIKRLYQDTASHHSTSHCHYSKLEELIPPSMRKQVFCMHFDDDYIDLLHNKGFSVIESI